jgi:hypothetical protein
MTPLTELTLYLPWRCSTCGAEGAITTGENQAETYRRMQAHHERLKPDCVPRFIVVEDGRPVVIQF